MFKFKKMKFLIIVIFTILILFIVKITYSKFTHSIKVDIKSPVAENNFFISSSEQSIVKDVLGNEQITYDFSINASSEVKSKYDIILELSQDNPPLIIELYKIIGNTEEIVELENYSTKKPEILDIRK